MTKGTNITYTNLFLTICTKQPPERIKYVYFSFLHYRIQFFRRSPLPPLKRSSPAPELLTLEKEKNVDNTNSQLWDLCLLICVWVPISLYVPSSPRCATSTKLEPDKFDF